MEYLDYESINLEQQHSIKSFKSANYREKSNVNQPLLNTRNSTESENPAERILRRLNSYDFPKSAPHIKKLSPIIPQLNLVTKEAMFHTLQPYFNTLLQFAQ